MKCSISLYLYITERCRAFLLPFKIGMKKFYSSSKLGFEKTLKWLKNLKLPCIINPSPSATDALLATQKKPSTIFLNSNLSFGYFYTNIESTIVTWNNHNSTISKWKHFPSYFQDHITQKLILMWLFPLSRCVSCKYLIMTIIIT